MVNYRVKGGEVRTRSPDQIEGEALKWRRPSLLCVRSSPSYGDGKYSGIKVAFQWRFSSVNLAYEVVNWRVLRWRNVLKARRNIGILKASQ